VTIETIRRTPDQLLDLTPLLFVHGAWHGAWCWEDHFLDHFAAQGREVGAVSLRHHGNSTGQSKRVRWCSKNAYVFDVEKSVAEFSRPPVLVGHSMGGYITQHYLARHEMPGAVLMASIPPNGVVGTTLALARRHPLAFIRSNLTMSLAPYVATVDLVREKFFGADTPEEVVQHCFDRLSDESFRVFIDMLISRPDIADTSTPMLVMGALRDALISPKAVAHTAEVFGAELKMIDTAHDMMLEPEWALSATVIDEWLTSRKL
jgi:pimeloyl-ACP methyl ester carboxylesterase